MVSSEIENIVVKYLTHQATSDELDTLLLWLDNTANEKEFAEYVKVNYAIDFNMKDFNTTNSKKNLLELIDKEKKVFKVRKIRNVVKYAAAVIIVLGLGYFYKQNYLVDTDFSIPEDKITLQLDNGDIEILNEDGSKSVVDKSGNIVIKQSGNTLTYLNDDKSQKLVYNTLTVPYGKHFKLTLSDGTRVHLNSGTSLKYPVQFIRGEKRSVYLNGEAFFSVTENKNDAFTVASEALNVEVMGTEFNVTAYPEDSVSNVVLVEGSVGVYNEDTSVEEATVIKPGTKAALDKNSKTISTEEVNTFVYTSWRSGGLFFRNMPFKNIVKKMERHYNMKIVIANKALENEIFSANFDDEPITKILSYFKDSYNINYVIKNNTITIN